VRRPPRFDTPDIVDNDPIGKVTTILCRSGLNRG
jgi:hypothetical protein